MRGRDSYFVQFGYLRQRDRLAEDVARVLLLELLQGFSKEDEEGGQLHLHGDLLDLDLPHIKAPSARPRLVPWGEVWRGGCSWCGNSPSFLPHTAGCFTVDCPFLELPAPATCITSFRSPFIKHSCDILLLRSLTAN